MSPICPLIVLQHSLCQHQSLRIGIADDEPHNTMNAVVPNDLEDDYVVVGYVDRNAQQPKEHFQTQKLI